MSIDHDDTRRALGAYVLGALEPPERALVADHLAGCAECREELAELAGLPGLMSRLSAQEAEADLLAPPPQILPALLARVRQERARRRGRGRLRAVAASALGAAAVAAAVLLVPALTPGPTPVTLTAAADAAAAGEVALADRPWGTAVRLTVRLPDSERYTAWAVDPAGARTAVATWGRTPEGRMTVDGATALHRAQLRSVLVTDAEGHPLLSARLA